MSPVRHQKAHAFKRRWEVLQLHNMNEEDLEALSERKGCGMSQSHVSVDGSAVPDAMEYHRIAST